MAWDYSIYPDLTEMQKQTFASIGETLYLIQMAEAAIQNCNRFVFGNSSAFSVERIFGSNEKQRKKTLGQLLSELRKQTAIHKEFDSMLKTFVESRNFFVHSMFNYSHYSLSSNEQCQEVEKFLADLQDYAWNVQNVFLGCLMNWAKQSGVYDHLPNEIKNNKHLVQLDKQPYHRLFEQSENEVAVRMVKQKPAETENAAN